MARTEFTQKFKEDSDKGHELFCKEIFPIFFPNRIVVSTQLYGENVELRYYDSDLAVDYILRHPYLPDINLQSRIRPITFYDGFHYEETPFHYRRRIYFKDEVSINFLNMLSGILSEWKKLQRGYCNLFFFAFYDSEKNEFKRWCLLDGLALGRILKSDGIKFYQALPNKKKQVVRYIELNELHRTGCLLLAFGYEDLGFEISDLNSINLS